MAYWGSAGAAASAFVSPLMDLFPVGFAGRPQIDFRPITYEQYFHGGASVFQHKLCVVIRATS